MSTEKMLKLQIRDYLLSVKKYLNLSGISREVGVSKQVISIFLRDEYHLDSISLNTLIKIKDLIHNL